MSTVLDILNQSLTLVGMRAAGEIVDAALAQDALTVLNQLIASWGIESILVYTLDRVVFSLVANQQTYTVGTGGDVNILRPPRIEVVNWRDETQTPALELPLDPMSDQEYEALRVRGVTATLPTQFYYDQAYPLAVLFLWPIPTLARKLVLYVWHPWSSSYVLSDSIAFPPGYERFLVYSLAVELSAQPGARITPTALKIAEDSKAVIASLNVEAPIMSMPAALFGSGRLGRFNPLTGENRR